MKNYFAHCVDVEELYQKTVSSVCEKHGLTYMEFTILLFLANNPQYDTAAQIVKYRHLSKSHVSVSIRSLEERSLISGEHRGTNHRTVHLIVSDKADNIIADGRTAQTKFCEIIFSGFSKEEIADMQTFTDRINRNIKEYTGDVYSGK
ncbi:MarR family winged helix-turn-helix transcriptional regulator [Huintestinicola sp.]|uniref:MarR family winged helix-turn-helix transcriptional regulator n=1 Tax=Huintestinicola sp. TaxID=2981661 RepID=UPI00307B89E1